MYNFIIGLFTEEEYQNLLEEESTYSRDQQSKILTIPSDDNSKPFVFKKDNLTEELDDNPVFQRYSNRRKLLEYFNCSKFVNPTHNNSNNIGANSAFISHTPTHIKITKAFINDSKQTEKGNPYLTFTKEKINAFKKSIKKTIYFKEFPELCERVAKFMEKFEEKKPHNIYELSKNDFIVFLVEEKYLDDYLTTVEEYTMKKVLKYPTYPGICDSCGKEKNLYMITKGNTFDLTKHRKYLLRHPTRYKTNLKSKASPENYTICADCAKEIYNFFEFIKKYKYYRFVFPIKKDLRVDYPEYKTYSSNPIGILKMLRKVYKNNHSEPFDYLMIITDPGLENIEFRYVSDFDYKLNGKIAVRDIPMFHTLTPLSSDEKEGKIKKLSDERNKGIFLSELNLLFNNTLIPFLFESDPSKFPKSLHPFLKTKIIEYNTTIRDFVYFQNPSYFQDRIHTRFFKEMLSELVSNSSLRNDMKLGVNKIRYFLTIYYKYINVEPSGGEILMNYQTLKNRIKNEKIEGMELRNDFEASYFMGQLFYYLLRVSIVKNRIHLFTQYTMNIHNMERLKQQLLTVLEKYSHNEFIDNNRKLHNLMKNILSYEFRKSYEENKIPIYTGYFDNNHLYADKEKEEVVESDKKEVK
jgi:hypothetical protein